MPTFLSRLAGLALAIGLSACLFSAEPKKHCGTEVGDNHELAGCLVDPQEDPVGQVAVAVVRVPDAGKALAKPSLSSLSSAFAGAAGDTLGISVSDKRGRFSFIGLPAGEYTLVAASGDLRLLSGGIVYDGKSRLFRNKEVMLPVGSIKGRLLSAGSESLSGFVCWLLGTNRSFATDGEGRFRFDDLPSGSYSLRCMKTGFRDHNLVAKVEPGEEKDLGDVWVSSLTPPGPAKVAKVWAEFDGVTGKVHVHWSRVPSPDGGASDKVRYLVSRQSLVDPDSPFESFGPLEIIVADTSFTDYLDWSLPNPADTLIYIIRSMMLSGVGQTLFGDPNNVEVAVKPPTSRETQVWMRLLNLASDSCRVGDTAQVQVNFSSAYYAQTRLVWKDGSEKILDTFALQANSGSAVLPYACQEPGLNTVQALVSDEVGRTWPGKVDFSVFP